MKYLILLALFISCAATVESDAKAKWELCGPATIKQKWRLCDQRDLDQGKKGWCYITLECKKSLFGKKKRNKLLHCAYGDENCFRKHLFDKKRLKR